MTNCINGLVNKYCEFVSKIPASNGVVTAAGTTIASTNGNDTVLLKAARVKKMAAVLVAVAVVASIIFGAVVGGAAWIALGATLALTVGFGLLHQKAVATLQGNKESQAPENTKQQAAAQMPELTAFQLISNAPLLIQAKRALNNFQSATAAVFPSDGSHPTNEQVDAYKATRDALLKIADDNKDNPLMQQFSGPIETAMASVTMSNMALKNMGFQV